MTLAQLKTAIRARGYDTDTDAEQTEILNSIYREIHSVRRWSWLRKTATPAVVAGTENVTLPTDAQKIEAVYFRATTDAAGAYDSLQYLEPNTLAAWFVDDAGTGRPTAWTHARGVLTLFPDPDTAGALRVDYIERPADLSAPGDIPVIPVEFHDVLVWGAVAELAFRERDYAAADRAAQIFQRRLSEMSKEEGVQQRQTGAEVTRTGHWDAYHQVG